MTGQSSPDCLEGELIMIRLAIVFFVIALAAAYFGGFGGVSDYSWTAASTVFFLFLALGALSVLGRVLKWPYA